MQGGKKGGGEEGKKGGTMSSAGGVEARARRNGMGAGEGGAGEEVLLVFSTSLPFAFSRPSHFATFLRK